MSSQSVNPVEATVVALVTRWAPGPVDNVNPDQLLVEDLGYDSLAIVELVTDLELEFEIEPIAEEDFGSLARVGDLVALLVRLASDQDIGGNS